MKCFVSNKCVNAEYKNNSFNKILNYFYKLFYSYVQLNLKKNFPISKQELLPY